MAKTPSSATDMRRWIERTRYVASVLLVSLALTVAACSTTTNSGPGKNTTPSPSANPSRTTVKVFFTRHPDSDNDPTKVFAVSRTVPPTATTTEDEATFALDQLLARPTQAEQAQGIYS